MNGERYVSMFWNTIRKGYALLSKFEKYPSSWKTLDDIFAEWDRARLEKEQTCSVDVINRRWYCPYSGKYDNMNVFVDICEYAEIVQIEHPITQRDVCACTNFSGQVETKEIDGQPNKHHLKRLFGSISPKARLKRRLTTAVRNEDFEEAVRIRDILME